MLKESIHLFVRIVAVCCYRHAVQAQTLKIAGLDGGWGREHWDELARRFEA